MDKIPHEPTKFGTFVATWLLFALAVLFVSGVIGYINAERNAKKYVDGVFEKAGFHKTKE